MTRHKSRMIPNRPNLQSDWQKPHDQNPGLLSKNHQVADTAEYNLCWRQTSGDFDPISYVLPLLQPHTKVWKCKANQQPGWDWSQTKALRNLHLDHYVARVWSRLVSFLLGAWHHLGNPSLVLASGTPPRPHWGWGHNRKNYTLYECLSPSVYYKNRCAPTSPWLSENRPEQSVERYPGKPVMTTSGSIWLSVGRVMAHRETETVGQKRKKKALCDCCRWVFVSIPEFHFFFLSCNKANECVEQLSAHMVRKHRFAIQQLGKKMYAYQIKDKIMT